MKNKNSKTVHLITQAHIDLSWMWPFHDGYQEVLNTAHSIVKLLDEFPQMNFSCSSAAIHRWIEDTAPDLFKKIKGFVAEGRWEPVGGWVVEADCNLPSGESFVRQGLYGKRYFKERFNFNVEIGYTVDAFGMNGGLPQILGKSGYRYHVYSKPRASKENFPPVFWWQGADGSRVLTSRILPPGYCEDPNDSPDEFEKKLFLAADNNFVDYISHIPFFMGVGDHGGGPSRNNLKRAMCLLGKTSEFKIQFSTLREYFKCLEETMDQSLVPVIRGEIQGHNIGCYSAVGKIKSQNRQCEQALLVSESIVSLSLFENLHDGSRPDFDLWWESLLQNQFHDVIAGTCTAQSYESIFPAQHSVLHGARSVTLRAIQRMSQAVDTSAARFNVLFLYNPLPWSRRGFFTIDQFTGMEGAVGKRIHSIKDMTTGESYPVQWTHADSSFGPWLLEWKKLIGTAELPPCGYKTYSFESEEASPLTEPVTVTPLKMKNTFFSIEFDSEFLGISSWKINGGAELLSSSMTVSIFEDDGDTFGHGKTTYPTLLENIKKTRSSVIEEGPLRGRIRMEGLYGASNVVLDCLVYHDSAAVEMSLSINWQEKRKGLKLMIPVTLKDGRALFEMPYDVATRHMDGAEGPGHTWCVVSGFLNEKKKSVYVVNDFASSISVHEHSIQTILCRSARHSQYGESSLPAILDDQWMDIGTTQKKFWLTASGGNVSASQCSRLAQKLNTPLERTWDTAHGGTEPREKSFLEVSGKLVRWGATKSGLKKDSLVLRFHELDGLAGTVTLSSVAMGFKEEFHIRPHELLTFLLLREGGRFVLTPCDLMEN